MAVPASIQAALTVLQTNMEAATPIAQAPFPTLVALQGQAVVLANSIDASVTTGGLPLDASTITGIGPQMVASFQTLVAFGFDESALVDMRGFVGRIATNLLEVNS